VKLTRGGNLGGRFTEAMEIQVSPASGFAITLLPKPTVVQCYAADFSF
jgi:hypothetical protein